MDSDSFNPMHQNASKSDDESSESSSEQNDIIVMKFNQPRKKNNLDFLMQQKNDEMIALIEDENEYQSSSNNSQPNMVESRDTDSNFEIDYGSFYNDPFWGAHHSNSKNLSQHDFVLDSENDGMYAKPAKTLYKKRNADGSKVGYFKTMAKSDEHSFMRSRLGQPLTTSTAPSMIEEENKSANYLKLSTTSKSYKPIVSHSKSISSDMSIPIQSAMFNGGYPSSAFGCSEGGAGMRPGVAPNHPNYTSGQKSGIYYQGTANAPKSMVYSIQPAGQGEPLVAQATEENHNSTLSVPLLSGKKKSKGKGERAASDKSNKNKISSPSRTQQTAAEKQKLKDEGKLLTGYLKFFNQQFEYGFLVSDSCKEEIFFHFDDIKHTRLPKNFLRHVTDDFDVKLSFNVMEYNGKQVKDGRCNRGQGDGPSKKAVNINLLSIITKHPPTSS